MAQRPEVRRGGRQPKAGSTTSSSSAVLLNDRFIAGAEEPITPEKPSPPCLRRIRLTSKKGKVTGSAPVKATTIGEE